MHNTQCNIYIYTVFASAVLVATAMYGFSYLQNTTAHVILKALISRDAMYNQGMMIALHPKRTAMLQGLPYSICLPEGPGICSCQTHAPCLSCALGLAHFCSPTTCLYGLHPSSCHGRSCLLCCCFSQAVL